MLSLCQHLSVLLVPQKCFLTASEQKMREEQLCHLKFKKAKAQRNASFKFFMFLLSLNFRSSPKQNQPQAKQKFSYLVTTVSLLCSSVSAVLFLMKTVWLSQQSCPDLTSEDNLGGVTHRLWRICNLCREVPICIFGRILVVQAFSHNFIKNAASVLQCCGSVFPGWAQSCRWVSLLSPRAADIDAWLELELLFVLRCLNHLLPCNTN